MARVTDLIVVRKRTGQTEVWLDGEPWIRVEAEIVVHFGLRKGLELDEKRLEKIALQNEILRARQALARYTALTLRTEKQARENLIRKGFQEGVIEAALERARELGWINDQRYAEAYIRQRERIKPAGPRRLRADMAARGINADMADETLERLGPDDETLRNNATAQAEKKWRLWRGRYEGADLKARLIQYLARQGYESDLAHSIAREMLDREL